MSRNQDPQRRWAILLLVFTAILWSAGGLLIKSITLPPLAIAGGRSAIAALVLLPLVRRSRLTWSWPQLLGAVAYAGTVILFVLANKLTTAANAIMLQYTAPIFVALFSAAFLGERATWIDWTTIVLVIGGMGLFFFDRLSVSGWLGNLVAIASGVTMAGMVIALRKQKDGSPLESVWLGNILTALIGVPFMIGHSIGGTDWLYLAILGLFQLGLSYALYSRAIKYVSALEGILIPVIEPILNPIWVFLILAEKPGRWALLGGVIVLAAVTARCLAAVYASAAGSSPASKI